MTTDYAADRGCPEPYLRRIADAGFSHVHWCHQWNTDFLYSASEIEQIEKWLREYRLGILDLHASSGVEKGWFSPLEYERLAGVELVKNRIEMAARLSSDVIIMHVGEPKTDEELGSRLGRLRRSMDALAPFAEERGVRIALENGGPGSLLVIEALLSEYGPESLGICYDSGHGNMTGHRGLDWLDPLKARLISVHLHDNDGAGDQHKLLFTGTVDWRRLAGVLALSAYGKCVNMETSMRCSDIKDEAAFLAKAFETGAAFSGMIKEEMGSVSAQGLSSEERA
ncbi:MAG: sugar phosphate isomerase/epimerase family protein [Planctomycetota bacterium]